MDLGFRVLGFSVLGFRVGSSQKETGSTVVIQGSLGIYRVWGLGFPKIRGTFLGGPAIQGNYQMWGGGGYGGCIGFEGEGCFGGSRLVSVCPFLSSWFQGWVFNFRP